MEDRSELVSKRVRTKVVTEIEVDRYFDGEQCLGDNLTKAAVTYYGMSRNQIARLVGTDRKTVGEWYKGKRPHEANRKKIFEAVKAWRKMKLDLERTMSQTKKVKIQVDESPAAKHNAINPVNDAPSIDNPLDPAS